MPPLPDTHPWSMLQKLLHSNVTTNALALYMVQGLQYLIPLISLPWLVRALGTSGYGLFILAGACGSYAQVLCDYGFHLSATRQIARAQKNVSKISQIVCSTLAAKVGLAVVGFSLVSAVLATLPSFRQDISILWIGCFASLASSFFPSWLFQGMERMKGMAIIAAGSKLLQLLGLIIFVHTPSDVAKALFITLATNLLSAFAAWALAIRLFPLKFELPKFKDVHAVLSEGFEIFLSQAGVSVFANANVMALGIIGTKQVVGTYSVAEKIVRVGINLGAPLGTALYPRVAVMIDSSQKTAYIFLKKVLLWGGTFFLVMSLSIALLAGFAARIITGNSSPLIIHLVWILSPLPLSIFIDNVLGTQLLLNLGYRKEFMSGPLSSGLVSIVLLALLAPHYGAYGAAVALLVSEFLTLFLFAYFVYKKTGFFRKAS